MALKVETIKGVITLEDGSTSEFLITEQGWNQWNAEGWRDPTARLAEVGPVLTAMEIATAPAFLEDTDAVDEDEGG